MNSKILVIDDERSLLDTMQLILSRAGHSVLTAGDAVEALKIIKEFDSELSLIISDLALPGGFDGMNILEAVKDLGSDTPVIMITAYGNVEIAVEAMQKGAYNFLTKPVNFKVLIQQVQKAIETASIFNENKRLRNEIENIRTDSYKMIYISSSMEELLESAVEIAKTDETVLIIGESGTGKELLARHVLRESPRSNKPFVAFNAAAVSESLMEAELFGYKKGAFTGADRNNPGYIGTAQGGTLFIDEIGEMPLSLQSKLLRFLQEKEYLPVGSSVPVKADVRVVAATNKDLKKEVEKGAFREDLYYRLSVFPICIPPLRERKEDIPLLVKHFAEKLSRQYKKQMVVPDADTIRSLSQSEWRGNIRELENYMARFVLSGGKTANKPLHENNSAPVSYDSNGSAPSVSFVIGEKTMKEIEKEVILKALKFTGGNKNKAAELLDVSQRTIYRRITEEDI